MTETTVGREPIQIVEIQQPFCAETFGSAPCTATGTADEKCYNTRATCLDTANFNKTSLSLYFSKGNVAEQNVSGAAYIIPSLVSVSTSPTKINLSGQNPDATGLGNRALCTITFNDHPHSDRKVDPYLAGRSWDALDRGSFWSKWIKRNKYRQNAVINIYEGYSGQALGAMTKRTYILDSVQGPDGGGRYTIKGKDVLAKAEERKAQAPTISPGELLVDITDAATSITVTGATTSDYSASGTLRIDRECMTYSSVATSGSDIVFTISARGTDGTTAAAHTAETLAQDCLRFTGDNLDDVCNTLLGTYAGIAAGYLDTAGWATEVDTYATAYTITTLITEPTAVAKLLSELQQHASFYLWWDDRAAKVKLKVVRGVTSEPDLLTAENNIMAGSFKITELPRERVSQVWVYFGQIDPTEGISTVGNYSSAQIAVDLESEGEDLYGESQVLKMQSRWLSTFPQALSTATKVLTRYVDNPRAATFQMDAKDRAYWTGDTVRISHPDDVDAFGARQVNNWTITSAEEIVAGEIVRYSAQDTTLYGIVRVVMANGTADWQGDGTDQYNGSWIGDNSGLLSDGTESARIT